MNLSLVLAADTPYGVGLEWLAIASVLVPAFLLVLIIYLGSRNTV